MRNRFAIVTPQPFRIGHWKSYLRAVAWLILAGTTSGVSVYGQGAFTWTNGSANNNLSERLELAGRIRPRA